MFKSSAFTPVQRFLIWLRSQRNNSMRCVSKPCALISRGSTSANLLPCHLPPPPSNVDPASLE
eukprot:5700373-Karenia_brevis.AAC.1